MAENLYKVISVFFHEKYCILRPVFPGDETRTTCLSNFRNLITQTRPLYQKDSFKLDAHLENPNPDIRDNAIDKILKCYGYNRDKYASILGTVLILVINNK
jgi:hypothetical protein